MCPFPPSLHWKEIKALGYEIGSVGPGHEILDSCDYYARWILTKLSFNFCHKFAQPVCRPGVTYSSKLSLVITVMLWSALTQVHV